MNKEYQKELRNIERSLCSSDASQRKLGIELLTLADYSMYFDTYFRWVLTLYYHIDTGDYKDNDLQDYWNTHILSNGGASNDFVLALLNEGITSNTKLYFEQALSNIISANWYSFYQDTVLPQWMQGFELSTVNVTINEGDSVYVPQSKKQANVTLKSLLGIFKKINHLYIDTSHYTLKEVCNMTSNIQLKELTTHLVRLQDYHVVGHNDMEKLAIYLKAKVEDDYLYQAPTGLEKLTKLDELKLSHLDVDDIVLPKRKQITTVNIVDTKTADRLLEKIKHDYDKWDGQEIIVGAPDYPNVHFKIRSGLPF